MYAGNKKPAGDGNPTAGNTGIYIFSASGTDCNQQIALVLEIRRALKRAIVFLAIRKWIPVKVAEKMIQQGGLIHD